MEENSVRNENINCTVDVIIPTYRSDEKFNKLIGMLYRQTIKPNRIIILHTEEYEGQEQPLPTFTENNITIVPIEISKFDHGGTRKYGASLSDAEILMFMTQDAVPEDEFLIEKLLEPYTDPWVAATYARQLPDDKVDMIERYIRHFNYPSKSSIKSLENLEDLGIKTFFCSDVCATYRRSIYNKMGGFVDKTIFNEDMIMAAAMIRADYNIAYVAEAKVIHSHNYSYLQQFSRNFDLGVSHNQYSEVFSGVKSESEGIKMVKNTMQYLMNKKKHFLIPDLIMSSGFKYLGYQLGLHYDILPRNLVVRCSMNKAYWR
jgi:Glycosyltransferases, probably involved in cell wall biogenesis